MYVCLCSGVTDKQILEAAAKGFTSVEALNQKLGVGANCGSCLSLALELIDSYYDSTQDAAIFYKVA